MNLVSKIFSRDHQRSNFNEELSKRLALPFDPQKVKSVQISTIDRCERNCTEKNSLEYKTLYSSDSCFIESLDEVFH